MPIVNKPDMNYGMWAENGNIEIPSSEKVEEGWVIEKPLNEQANWVENRQDKMLQYINQRGIPEWDLRTEYPESAYVAYLGSVYRAVSQNVDQDPSLNTEIWVTAFVNYQDFIDFSETITKIKEDEGYLDLYVSKANPVMDAMSKGIGYGNSTGGASFNFVGNKPNVSVNGAVIAEFGNDKTAKEVITREMLALEIQSYKVDDIYITTGTGDPKDRLGYGTWVRFSEGRVLVGFSTDVSTNTPAWTKTVGSESGKYQDNIKTTELPNHKHTFVNSYDGSTSNSRARDIHNWSNDIVEGSIIQKELSYSPDDTNDSGFLQYTKDMPHTQTPLSVVQPSIVVFLWKRVS